MPVSSILFLTHLQARCLYAGSRPTSSGLGSPFRSEVSSYIIFFVGLHFSSFTNQMELSTED